MTKCVLGAKKKRKIEAIIGYKVRNAYVRGGWDHFWVEVWLEGIDSVPMHGPNGKLCITGVNYKTGEILWNDFDKAWLERCVKVEAAQPAVEIGTMGEP